MARQVAIVHGWSDTSKSFKPLAAFLRKNGFEAVQLWLGDYISLDDDVKIEDVAKRLHHVIQEKMGLGLEKSFDLIVHSTGGLVARQWLTTYYPQRERRQWECLSRAAPSDARPGKFRLETCLNGQSMLGRVVKGFDNWFHTGKEMLTALELASEYQWDLAQRDLFLPEGKTDAPSPYGKDGVLPFVIIGTHPYTSELRQIVNENGADGTVRVPAANMNVRGITIDFSVNEAKPALKEWGLRHGDLAFPLAVLPDRTHGSIITPEDNEVASPPEVAGMLGKLILEALNCPGIDDYVKLKPAWDAITEETASLALDNDKRTAIFPPHKILGFVTHEEPADYFNQYMQVVVRVVDDHGIDVPDFFLEFFGPQSKTDREAIYFHGKVLEEVHTNGPRRCLYVDRTDLVTNYYKLIPEGKPKVVAMSVSAAPPGDNISYFEDIETGAAGHLIVHNEDETQARWLRRNCTHFAKIIIPRAPKDNVFKLTKAAP